MDVIERLAVTINSSGYVLTSEVDGAYPPFSPAAAAPAHSRLHAFWSIPDAAAGPRVPLVWVLTDRPRERRFRAKG